MAAIAPVEVPVGARRLHALGALIEKHAAAIRADLDKFMAEDNAPVPGSQHTVRLDLSGAHVTHPAACADPDACPYAEDAANLPRCCSLRAAPGHAACMTVT